MITSLFDLIVNPAKMNYTCLCLNCGLKLRVFRMAFEVLSWQHLSFQVIWEHTFRFWTPLCIFALGHWSCHIILIKYQILCWYENVTLLFASFIITFTLMLISQVESLPSSEYQLFWLRNLVLNAKQIFLDRHSLHAMNSSMKNKTIHQSYLSCHHCVLYCKQTWNVKLQYIHISYVSCSTPIIVNCMFRAPWLEENKRKWTWNYYWIAH